MGGRESGREEEIFDPSTQVCTCTSRAYAMCVCACVCVCVCVCARARVCVCGCCVRVCVCVCARARERESARACARVGGLMGHHLDSMNVTADAVAHLQHSACRPLSKHRNDVALTSVAREHGLQEYCRQGTHSAVTPVRQVLGGRACVTQEYCRQGTHSAVTPVRAQRQRRTALCTGNVRAGPAPRESHCDR